ncbi:MAG: pentapeptide repeat-containing protein, partial [Rhizobiales bacterium]|nr:pentapeptide repeat-containing protein [Hyphomicrobiales bacterium]
MFQNLRAAIVALTTVGMAAPALAGDAGQLQQLLSTRKCPGCDLSNANLGSANLWNADLRHANLA